MRREIDFTHTQTHAHTLTRVKASQKSRGLGKTDTDPWMDPRESQTHTGMERKCRWQRNRGGFFCGVREERKGKKRILRVLRRGEREEESLFWASEGHLGYQTGGRLALIGSREQKLQIWADFHSVAGRTFPQHKTLVNEKSCSSLE